MFSLLAKVIPLDIASALSPVIFALALLLLGSKKSPKLRAFSLFLGIVVVGIIIAIVGYFLGQNVPDGSKQTLVSAVVDLAFGAILIFFGIKQIVTHERKLKKTENESSQLTKWFFVGLLGSATNFDAVFLILTAAKETGSAGVGEMLKIVLLLISVLFFAAPAGLPLLFYIIMPEVAVKFLTLANAFVFKYSKYFLFAMFMVFGLILLYRGLRFFV